MKSKKTNIFCLLYMVLSISAYATEYHVAKSGNDKNPGTTEKPFLSIQAAANIAKAGDIVTVHEGIYRERVDPKFSGTNDQLRIIYQAGEGEKVIIKGSEIVRKWKRVEGTVWKASVPNSIFKDYNPYLDLVVGDWFNPEGIKHHTGEIYINNKSLFEQNSLDSVMHPVKHEKTVDINASLYAWYAEVGDEITTFWANFQELNPNNELVEINVRPACFYPSITGRNYLTIRGFEMQQAATQWAAPTAEQPGLIGTNWSKGWIIENNRIRHSKSVGIALGKSRESGQNVWMHNKNKDGATHYNEVIFRALDIGWSKENIGSHIVRNNEISDCGQAGVVGSLGAVYSRIYNNHIYNIYTKRTYSGAEMAGIKIHAAIDVIIHNNRIHDAFIGIWLDWMSDGARISSNLLYNNSHHDLFLEVNHGPTLVDNNLLLSEEGISFQSCSEGVALVHNIFNGKVKTFTTYDRSTPYHLAHSTKVKGVRNLLGGDCRFYNNIFIKNTDFVEETQITDRILVHVGYGLNGYDMLKYPSFTGGNVFYAGAKPYKNENNYITKTDYHPEIELMEDNDEITITLAVDDAPEIANTNLITTKILGSTVISEACYENPDGSPIVINSDYSGNERNPDHPTPGPFENLSAGENSIRIW